MSRDESDQTTFYFDPLTGIPTAIIGPEVSEHQRAACTAFNRQRAGGIIQVRETAQRRESIQADVWRHTFTGRLADWEVPIVPLEKLGIWVEEGHFESDSLTKLKAGAEASPFADYANEVVYKLFDLRFNGGLGKKLELIKHPEESRHDLINTDADVIHTVQKILLSMRLEGTPPRSLAMPTLVMCSLRSNHWQSPTTIFTQI